ncbi:ABC transporter permease [Herbaspirillum sp. WKF16]|uniref:ABC transporter permease n=1 Tax=Herbaspirillum sp. WKF16 TaxID=3028312 RepID=UPI0023A94A93|nr:ABC transporter permease [Herbaspirillum sp. WKF16]WDZ95806.1 ABC transporter permease [Herbaspirillum sp. WKF16]
MSVLSLSAMDLALASILIVVNGIASLALGLQVHRSLAVAAVRMMVQLLLVGVILRWILGNQSPMVTAIAVLVMIAAAAREVSSRPRTPFQGRFGIGISAVVVGASSLLTVALALSTAIRPQPWYDPRYAIPLMGIVLGSVLNSASISLDSFLSAASSAAAEIETRLALGATRNEAVRPQLIAAIRSGMLPVINQMSAAGLITLPGIMTGQVLAGMDALEAAKYQVLLMFILAGASGLAAYGCASLASIRLTDSRHRLRLDRLRSGSEK